MARGSPRQIGKLIIIVSCVTICTCLNLKLEQKRPQEASFTSAKVTRYVPAEGDEGEKFRRVDVLVHGENLHAGLGVAATARPAERGALCRDEDSAGFKLDEVWTQGTSAKYALQVPLELDSNTKVYFCVTNKVVSDEIVKPFFGVRMTHQGVEASIAPFQLENDLDLLEKSGLSRSRRQGLPAEPIRVIGFKIDHASKEPSFDETGVPYLLAGAHYTIRLFGTGFTQEMVVTFTQERGFYGGSCQIPASGVFEVVKNSVEESTAQVQIKLPVVEQKTPFFVCIREGNATSQEKVSDSRPFVHQGSHAWMSLYSFEKMVPIWLAIMIICICLCFSALFSGLNLGLMSLDRTELKILCNTGTAKEKEYAKTIQPVRNHGNYLLCSILLGNVLVNSTFTILLDDLTSGLIAVISSTLAIVMFGEITPQAICSRHGLAVGAKTILITKLVMGITFPLSYPISKLLDVLLGEEIGSVYTRERLKELVKVTTGENDLDRDEVNIISGALELRKKTVADVMTRIEDTFMLSHDAILDFETVSEIMKSGYSRIPVYEGDRKNIVTTLYIKDLAFVDPDDNTPLKTLCQFYQNPCNFVFEDVTLDIMFKDFKEGNKGHMAFIKRVNSEGEGDPFYETIGLITLEDVIEELIQAEIMDETDVFTDNRTKRRRNADKTKQDFTVFAERKGENNRIRISPQLTLATFQYLSTSVDPFKPEAISETILRRLLKQEIIQHIKKNKDWRNDPHNIIYQRGKAADYFVLILEGRVEVTVGQEDLTFESGPFTYFGSQSLQQNFGINIAESPVSLGSLQSLNMDSMMRQTYQPDYTVRAMTEVLYMKLPRNLYMAAKRASLMERAQRAGGGVVNSSEQFDDEVDKFFDQSSDEFELRFEIATNNKPNEQLLHSLEDETSIEDNSPGRSKYSNVHNRKSSRENESVTSRTPSMKSPGVKTFESINGSIKNVNTNDDISNATEDESLLPKKS